MIEETFCIVFIWVFVSPFLPKTSKYIGVLNHFSEKSCNSANHNIAWSSGGRKIKIHGVQEGL